MDPRKLAQREIVKELCTNYNTILSNARTKLQAVTTTLSSLVPRLSPSQAAAHKQMMEKTDANLQKKKTQLATKTEKKLAQETLFSLHVPFFQEHCTQQQDYKA